MMSFCLCEEDVSSSNRRKSCKLTYNFKPMQMQEGYVCKSFQAVLIWRSLRRVMLLLLGCATTSARLN